MSIMRLRYFLLPMLFLMLATPLWARQATALSTCGQPLRDPITTVSTGEAPWGVVVTRDGCWAFASIGGGGNAVVKSGIAVLRRTERDVTMVHFEAVTGGNLNGIQLTHDEKTLVVGANTRVVFLDVEKLKSGQTNALLGSITGPRFGGAASLAITSDDQYLFIAMGRTTWVSVVDLKKARSTGFDSSAILGGFPVGPVPGMLLSPDGKYLYVTTAETVLDFTTPPNCKASADLLKNREAAIFVFDVERAITKPAEAEVAAISASCRPAGMAFSPDGNTLYVTSLEESLLLVFDTRPIRAGSSLKRIGEVLVPRWVERVLPIDGGKRLLVSSASLFSKESAPSKGHSLTIIDAQKTSSGQSAVIGTIDTAGAVANFAITPDGRSLVVANREASSVQFIDLNRVLSPPPAPVK
jgi:DNA-binding beta-propeller fold protein YncE